MPNTGTHAPWPALAAARSALWRVTRALLVLVLLVATTLLALALAAGLVLRALFTRRRQARHAGGEVVDVEAREIIVPEKHGH